MLTKILEQKQKEIDLLSYSKNTMDQKFRKKNHRPFSLKLQQSLKKPALIAEVKKASPSKGIIKEDFDPVAIAKAYEEAGATCLSVLTDSMFFKGNLNDLKEIRKHVSLPLLRKDFIIDEKQIIESVEYGADAILLIAACLTPERLRELYEFGVECGLECLIEVHSKEEIKTVYEVCDPIMIGINNRDLTTFTTNIEQTFTLYPELKRNTIVISESGIKGSEDIHRLKDKGIDGMLIGETLMRADDIHQKIREFYDGPQN